MVKMRNEQSVFFFLLLLFIFAPFHLKCDIHLGIDRLFTSEYQVVLRGKRVGLITNHTALNSQGISTIDLFKQNTKAHHYTLNALFAPEHGITGIQYASEEVVQDKDRDGVPIYSLHGTTRRPTPEMLDQITLLVFDIQDLGSRSYTYSSTLYYAMEEAAKANVPVVVLDRPNPISGVLIDGPMLEQEFRSFVGYVNVPYCHGMTIGELAHYFNQEYQIGCDLTIIPMKGWQRTMTFADTGLTWMPTSPNIPECTTAYYYPTTGFLGELHLVNIGIGYTLPFKVVGAPWINATKLAAQLNAQQLPGVIFHPFHYRPFFGLYAKESCHGVLIDIKEPTKFLPVTTQYSIMGSLKNLFPSHFKKALQSSNQRIEMFNKVTGTSEISRILKEEKYLVWKLRGLHQKERTDFLKKRSYYLIPDYQ